MLHLIFPDLRPYLCLTIEKTFSMCSTLFVDTWRLCGQILSLPSVSEFSWSDECTYWIFREIQVFTVFSCRDEFPRTYIQNCIFLPSLRTRRCVSIEFSCVRFPCTWPIFSTGCFEYPRIFDATGFCTVEELVETVKARFIVVGFDFATILSSPSCSCILFAIVLVQLVKLKFWEQQTEMMWLMLNRWRRLFHSSRVKFPLVNMSASWCLESTYLIWILGSRLILSNNQSRATLWVQDTCLIVGLLPLMIILITASLSSNTDNIAMDWENLTFESTLSRLMSWRNLSLSEGVSWFDLFLLENNATGLHVLIGSWDELDIKFSGAKW